MSFELVPQEADRLTHGKAVLAQRNTTFEMLEDFHVSEIHPDLIGLVALIISSPWVVSTLELPHSVSNKFADAVKLHHRVVVSSTSSTAAPRQTG